MRYLREPALRLVVAIGVVALTSAPISAQFCMTMVVDNTAPTKQFSVTAVGDPTCGSPPVNFTMTMSQSAMCAGGNMAMATHLAGSGAIDPMCTFTGGRFQFPPTCAPLPITCTVDMADGLPVELLDFAIDEDAVTAAAEEEKPDSGTERKTE